MACKNIRNWEEDRLVAKKGHPEYFGYHAKMEVYTN